MLRRFTTSLLFSLIASAFCLTPCSAQHKGEKCVGLRGGFASRNTTATAGLFFSYRFTEHFRLSPKFDYLFPHKSTDAFSFTLDFEWPFAFSTDSRWGIYPLAGVNYSTFSTHVKDLKSGENHETSQRSNQFGLTAGVGLEFNATPSLRIALEGNGMIMKRYSGALVNLSIGHKF